ncbi:aspartate carbamoyltransferase [candidate division MSBL1 archaeon SCGC-AAA261G05]|uniref:Aspartate carbamoyltransferase regulatory chain n=2 Tax=candidate division MSBL1 TaxID=215777 RepID=A0A133VBJ5_9EURY|nr:aspartate carbamoyltransferase [candidate division MSBL1 archaeon SCGC-AAA261G05]KXB04417.1 aspartate carbamoyltransferase [candidate division MSBL1 archaeon SCGC-AAA261O19]
MREPDRKLRVSKIESGTVIDHIPHGKAWAVLRILDIPGREDATVSILMNVSSEKHGRKDLIKVENRKLTKREVNEIALIASKATINIIEDYQVIEKRRVDLPEAIKGIVRCSNPDCITNASEPVESKFEVVNESPVTLRCSYCERVTGEEELLDQF